MANIRQEQALVAKGEKIPIPLRLKVRRDQVLGTQRAIDAIDVLFESSGGRALANGTYLQRAWRDAHAGRVHAANDPERALQMYGAHEFGHYFAARYHKVAASLPYFIPFPINPQIYHGKPTAVEFPAYESHLYQVRDSLRAFGFEPSSLTVSSMIDAIGT